MNRRFPWLRTGLVATSLLALAYPSPSTAQQPSSPPSVSPSPAPAPGTPAPQAPAGYQPGYQQQTPPAGSQQPMPPPGYQQPTPPPGYQQQTPPPGYYPQQPQPGYPQQPPPPGYYPQQAQPGYPQQPPPPGYYPQQPQPSYPPGYYPPQPGYAPAPGTAPVLAAPPSPGYRRGFLAMPYVGVQIPTGDSPYFGKMYDPGLRLGTFLGGHVGSLLSLNGELAIDILNYKHSGDVTAVAFDMLFSPLLHFGTGMFEGFVGPKIGGFANVISMKAGSITTTYTFSGMAYGVNAGFGIPLGNIALGGLFSYTGRSPSEGCVKRTGSSESCGDYHGSDWHSIAFSGMVLF